MVEEKEFVAGDSVSFIAPIQDAGNKGKSLKINITDFTRKENIGTLVHVILIYPKDRISDDAYRLQRTSTRIAIFKNIVDGKRDGMLQAKLVEKRKIYLITPENFLLYKLLVDFCLEYDENEKEEKYELEMKLQETENKILGIVDTSILLENEENPNDIKKDEYYIDPKNNFAFLMRDVDDMGINIFNKKFKPLNRVYNDCKSKLMGIDKTKTKKYENYKTSIEDKYGKTPKLIEKYVEEDIDSNETWNLIKEHIEGVVSASKGGKKSKRKPQTDADGMRPLRK